MSEKQRKRQTAHRAAARRALARDPDISGEELAREVGCSRAYGYALLKELAAEQTTAETEAARKLAASPHTNALRESLWRYPKTLAPVIVLLAVALDSMRWGGDLATESPPIGTELPAQGERPDERFKRAFFALMDAIATGTPIETDAALELRIPLPPTIQRSELPALLRALVATRTDAPAEPPQAAAFFGDVYGLDAEDSPTKGGEQ